MSLPAHRRRAPAHPTPIHRWDRSIIVFVTVCTKDRQPLLATPETTSALLQGWAAADQWRVGRYVILPDHVHLFCAPSHAEVSPLASWVGFWKRRAGMSITTGGRNALWQQNFWDVQLRTTESYASKWEYVRANPVRHGLVERPEDWPFQGEVHRLIWEGD